MQILRRVGMGLWATAVLFGTFNAINRFGPGRVFAVASVAAVLCLLWEIADRLRRNGGGRS